MACLRVILGDQLSDCISSLSGIDVSRDVILMCEVREEATYVRHHKKKIALIFSAMRHFAQSLEQKFHQVRYVTLDDPENTGSFSGEVRRAVMELQPNRVVVTEPSEYRVLEEIKSWQATLDLPVDILPDTRFLASHQEFADWAQGRKQLRMEYFYREMRKKYNVLMDDGRPAGGAWNYDQQNRKPPSSNLAIPQTYTVEPDDITRTVIQLVSRHFSDHFGDLEPFHYAVTRDQALQALDQFINQRLSGFGDYQDAMLQGEPWMYHSHLSFYINCGLLTPMECVQKAEQAFRAGDAPLNAVEGFIRQILGWREYVRGIYWLKMPDYERLNSLNATRKLPELYWGKPTYMNCLKQCVQETKEHAYAHHIQRLMVLGNFALLTGVDPDQVNEWYMIVYADAFQWVELPNVTGMTLFADGGMLGSKPYAASGAFIKKMSNYCKSCHYRVQQKNGPHACPFNYLYWDFLIRNRPHLQNNSRLGMPYRTLQRMSEEKIQAISHDAQRFLSALDQGQVV